MTREDIIDQLCHYWRPDYSITVSSKTHTHERGLTESQQYLLRKQMEQIFDRIIAPNMEFKK